MLINTSAPAVTAEVTATAGPLMVGHGAPARMRRGGCAVLAGRGVAPTSGFGQAAISNVVSGTPSGSPPV